MTSPLRRRAGTGALAIGVLLGGSQGPDVHAQQQFDLFAAVVSDHDQRPATDLTIRDLTVTEQGEPGRVVRMERYSLPVRLTILVDNGSGTADALVHYRRGLQALLERLPGDMEVGVLALSPNPRWLTRPSADRVQILRSVQLLTPDEFPSRMSDALVEYAQRLDRDFHGELAGERPPYVPVLVMLGSTGLDGSQARRDDLRDMLESMVRYGVRTYFGMLSQHAGPFALNAGSTVLVAKAVQELTGGAYVPLAASSRVAGLLPEWGEAIARTHRMGTNQYRVTLERPPGVTGPITSLRVFVTRDGYSGMVTADGRVP